MGAFVFFSLVTGLYATYGSRMNLSSILANLHSVTPGFMRAAQPFTQRQWDGIFAKHAFRTVINLRGDNPKSPWYRDELAACAAHDCRHHDIILSSKHLPFRETLLRLLDLLESEPRPLLVKCAGGAERTGLTSALWLLAQGRSVKDAHGQLKLFPYLHYPKKYQRWIREFLGFFEATRGDQTLRAWISSTYSDTDFANYLTAQGKGDYWSPHWK